MKTRPILIMAIAVLGIAAHTGMARAGAPNVPNKLEFSMSFCGKIANGPGQPPVPNCTNGMVYNSAAVIVTQVKVKQLAGPGGCKAVEKIHPRNMSLDKAPFGVWLRTDCEYRVQFTTLGCPDRAVKITPSDMTLAPPVTVAYLEGNCANLKGKKNKFRSKG